MGKVNRFMPTNEYSVYDVFEDGYIYWSFDEDEVTQTSCLTISFIRNVPNIENEHIKKMIYQRGLSYLDSKDYIGYSNKPGIFEELEFWDPHFQDIPQYLEEAKNEFKKALK